MQPHEERVVAEKQELDAKIEKLKTFCFGDNNTTFRTLLPIDRELLESQYTAMQQYTVILARRIARFK
jgi:hypothetical protein